MKNKYNISGTAANILIVIFTLVANLFYGNISAQVIVPFTQRTSEYTPSKTIYNIRGDYTIIGNTNLTLSSYGDNKNNSNNFMVYVDVDGNSNTLNSSSATLNFSTENSANPECSRIVYAGLYWTGRSSNSTSSPDVFTVTKGNVTKTYDKHVVYIKGPAGSNYTEIRAKNENIYYPQTDHGMMYSAYAEITDYVRANGIGEYTIADIALIEGNGGGTGYYGGWGMIVIYENAKMKWRDITVFDGHAYVIGGNASHDLSVSGFNTVQSGPVNMKLGLMAGEGDVGITGDYFKIINQQNNWVSLNHTGNSATNFFNGSIVTGGNSRTPNLKNNTGLDICMFDVPNPNNSVITNNQTSTQFRYGSTQDTYIIFFMAMAVDAYIPFPEGVNSVSSINGNQPGNPITAEPGQEVEFTLEIKNKGSEPINNFVVTIDVPYTVSYVSSSGSINFTPAPTPNNLYYDANLGPNGSIVWNLGTLPEPSNPETVLATLTYKYKVTTDCNILSNPICVPNIVSNGSFSGTGAVSNISFSGLNFIQGYHGSGQCQGEPILDPLSVAIDYNDYVNQNCSANNNYKDFSYCNFSGNIPVTDIDDYFPAGSKFYNEYPVTSSSVEYNASNPFPNINGTNTYYAVPPGLTDCYFEFTISVNSITSAPTASDIYYHLNETAVPLTATPSNPSYVLFFYTSNNFNNPQQVIIPSTDHVGETTYWVSEGISESCISSTKVPFKVIVIDTVPPVFTFCLSGNDQNVNTDQDVNTYTHHGSGWDATATDNDAVASLTYVLSGATTGSGSSLDGVVFNMGTTIVTWTATDNSGNTSECVFDVVVSDNQSPVFTFCLSGNDQSVNTDQGVNTYTHNGSGWDATATDNDAVASLTYVLSGATTGSGSSLDGVVFNMGTTTVTWTATDNSGNTSECVFNVVVSDNQSPVFTFCLSGNDQNVNTDQNVATYTHHGSGWDATATDNDAVASLTYVLSGATTGSGSSLDGVVFNMGTTTVTWTATDNSGNTSECVFNVVVSDNQSPVFTFCLSGNDQNVNTDQGVNTYTLHGSGWDATATDNDAVASLTYVLSGATTGSGSSLDGVVFNMGTTTVTWTATDNSGNTSVCVFNVIVTDNQSPVFTFCLSGNDQSVNTDQGVNTYSHHGSGWDATATDNDAVASLTYVLSGATTGSGSYLDGVVFNLGNTTVTWTAIDINGNISICTFEVNVIDNEAPVISCPPALFFCSPSDVNIGNATATDNVGVESIVNNAPAVFPIGTTIVTWTAADAQGNYSTCEQVVEVSLPATVYAGSDAEMCQGTEQYTVYDASASNYESLHWSVIQGEGYIENTTVLNATYIPAPGENGEVILQLIANSAKFCPVSLDLVKITIDKKPIVLTTQPDAICSGNSTELTVSGANSYFWTPGNMTGSSVTVSPNETTKYTVVGISNKGCLDTTQILVVVKPSPVVSLTASETEVYIGDEVYLQADGADFYTWNISELFGNQGSLIITENTYVEVIGEASNGCIGKDSVEIKILGYHALKIPEGYSPNGDGIHDTFDIIGIEAFPSNLFKVYNRWGSLVFESKGYHNEWNGYSNSNLVNGKEPMPEGTYYYVLDLGDGSELLSGWIYISR